MATSRFSPQFIEACLHKDLSPGESMPCPRCGSTDVKFRTPRLWRQAAAGLAAVAAALLLVRQMAAGAVVGGVCVLAVLVSLMDESRYVCGHCGHSWRHHDVIKWTKALRHDLGRKG